MIGPGGWVETEEGYEWDSNATDSTLHLPQAPDWDNVPSYVPSEHDDTEGEEE